MSAFGVQQTAAFEIGQSYTFRTVQMGLHSSRPWIRAAFPHHGNGKVKHETVNSHGHFMLLTMEGYVGTFIFKVTGPASHDRITATLYIVF